MFLASLCDHDDGQRICSVCGERNCSPDDYPDYVCEKCKDRGDVTNQSI